MLEEALCFNSRAREGRDRFLLGISLVLNMFQFTRPRRARRPRWCWRIRRSPVSIHAPAKGATYDFGMEYPRLIVSIHAPAKGATLTALGKTTPKAVSIHAPAKGATDRRGASATAIAVSIHAPAKGATASSRTICLSPLFQFTRPRRARPMRSMIPSMLRPSFNSRAREGRDNSPSAYYLHGAFQFTRPRRARLDGRSR